jgi:hypothetical protein
MTLRVGLAVFALAAPALPALSASRVAMPLTLVWVDPKGSAPFAAEGAMKEAIALLGAAGAEVRWRHAVTPNLLEEHELAVILVEAPGANAGLVMGSAPLADGAPAVWLHPEAVGKVLGLGQRALADWTPAERRGFARALGRVAAHEVVHAILGSARHSSTGLMSRSLPGAALVGPVVYIDAETRRAVGRAAAAPYRWTMR